jgi:GNAT superfamily N-acetyltransferase
MSGRRVPEGPIVWAVRRASAQSQPAGSAASGLPAPDWLDAIWRFRGEVLHAQGRRPGFLTAGGFSDVDAVDRVACHAVAHDRQGRVIGCIRLVPLAAHPTTTERLTGTAALDDSLREIGAHRSEAVEVGRWIVHPAWRGSSLGSRLVAAVWALCVRLDAKVALATVGTRDRQDVLLRRAGLRPIPGLPTVESAEYSDRLIFMYAITARPNRSIGPLVRLMNDLLPPVPADAMPDLTRAAGGDETRPAQPALCG